MFNIFSGKRTKMAFTGIGDAKAPRNIRKAQERNGTGKKYNSQLGIKIGWCIIIE